LSLPTVPANHIHSREHGATMVIDTAIYRNNEDRLATETV